MQRQQQIMQMQQNQMQQNHLQQNQMQNQMQMQQNQMQQNQMQQNQMQMQQVQSQQHYIQQQVNAFFVIKWINWISSIKTNIEWLTTGRESNDDQFAAHAATIQRRPNEFTTTSSAATAGAATASTWICVPEARIARWGAHSWI